MPPVTSVVLTPETVALVPDMVAPAATRSTPEPPPVVVTCLPPVIVMVPSLASEIVDPPQVSLISSAASMLAVPPTR